MVHSSAGFLLAIAYTAWATRDFFAGGWLPRLLKVVVAYVMSYSVLMTISVIGTIAWILSFGFGTGQAVGEDWNLFNATERNSVRVVSALLEEGADPNVTSERTPLHVAVEEGHAAGHKRRSRPGGVGPPGRTKAGSAKHQ